MKASVNLIVTVEHPAEDAEDVVTGVCLALTRETEKTYTATLTHVVNTKNGPMYHYTLKEVRA